jgi:TonB family protein
MNTAILILAMFTGVLQSVEPKVIQRVDPVYPPLARAARVSAEVKLSVVVNPDGSVKDVKITDGHTLLNNAAVEAMKQWKFGPTPTGGTVNVTVPFELPTPPAGQITGRVVDADGRPLPEMFVTLSKLYYRFGKRSWESLSGIQTDERGEYKIAAEPGEYLVTARLGGTKSDESDAAQSQRVFSPGTTDPATGVPVKVAVNSLAVADIRMPRLEDARGMKVSARILIPPLDEQPRAAVDIRLVRLDPQLADERLANASQRLENRTEIPIEFKNVRPGQYDLQVVFAVGSPGSVFSARLPIEVRDANIEGLVLRVHRNIELKGRVISEDRSIRLETLRLTLNRRSGVAAGGGNFQVAADGTVRMANVSEGTYNIAISGALGNAYVRDLRLGPSSIYTEGVVTVGSQPLPDLEVTLANGGSIDGMIETSTRAPVSNAQVFLVPDLARRQNPLFYKTGKSNSSGAFRFTGIAPGEYRILAFEVPQIEGAIESAEFLAQYEQRGVRVTLREGTALPALSIPVILKP